jgi:hypothetical protein
MSGLKGKTPSESYGDILVIGDLYNGLSATMEFVTDGLGNNTNIKCSKHSIDINFNGGELTSYRFNSACYKFDLIRSSWSGYHTIRIGNPAEVALITYYSDPYVSEDYELTVNLLPPSFVDKFSSSPIYAVTKILYSNAGVDSNVVFTSSDGYVINGLTSYFKQTNKSVSVIKVEFFSENIGLGGEFFVSLESEDFFKSGGQPDLTRLKSLCEDSTNLYGDYVRLGKSSKSAVPLSKASPGGSYRDLLYLNNNGSGLDTALEQLQDGAGNNSLISLSNSEVSISSNGGFINDGIFGSSSISPFLLSINDSNDTYTIKENIKDHIIIKYTSSSAEVKTFYINIDISNVPYQEASNSLETNVFNCKISTVHDTVSNFKLNVRFINTNSQSIYNEKIITAGLSTFNSINNYIVLYNTSIEEVFAY